MNARARWHWRSVPGQAAGLPPARLLIAGIGALLVVALAFSVLMLPDPTEQAGGAIGDLGLFHGVIEAVRLGDDYYAAMADALRIGGYPLQPFPAFRLPALALVLGGLPPWGATLLLYALAAAVIIAWTFRLRDLLAATAGYAAALILLAGGMIAYFQAALLPFHELWAGLCVALALSLRRPGRWIEAAALGLIAMLLRETAAVFVIVMGTAALIEGQRREALGWAAALAAFALVLLAHAYAVAQVTGPMDARIPEWLTLHGPALFVRFAVLATTLQALPLVLAAPLAALALVGWASVRDALAARVAATIATFALATALFAPADAVNWGLLTAPMLLIGLVFIPDFVRDLLAPLLDRRRVRVQRMVP